MRNHTECECVVKNRRTPQHHSRNHGSRVSHSLPKTTTRRPSMKRCKCPTHFDVDIDEDDESCGCMCNNKAECLRRFEGREGFTMTDQKLVQINCLMPIIFHFHLQMYHGTSLHSAALRSWNIFRSKRPLSRPK